MLKIDIGRNLLDQANSNRINGEYLEAQKLYSEILSANPCDTEALLGVGIIAQKLNSFDISLSFFSTVISIDRHHEEAFFQRGKTHFLAKNYKLAVADFTSTLNRNPSYVSALNSRGIANSQLLNFSCAVKDFEKAIEICPSNADLFYNRGLAHWNLKNYQAAIHDYTSAIELQPNYYQAFNNRGSAWRELADFKMALKDFEASTSLNKDFAEGYFNQSLIHLMNGEYEKAWPLYEYRWDSKHFPSEKRNFSEPIWRGEQPITGKTILIHSEQGLGDTLQFCRYLNLLSEEKCNILVEVEKPLLSIMRCLLPQENIFQKGSVLPNFDFHCPMLSLPLVFGTSINSVPFPKPYLKARHDRFIWWKNYLSEAKKLRIGICWRGNPNHPNDERRSMCLEDIIDTLEPEFDWFSLQFEVTEEEASIIDNFTHIQCFSSLLGDFSETAAFCQNLDAIICVDTSIAHLAGSIGSNTYLLLAQLADSRWHAGGSSTPWYNSVTILRQDCDTDYRALLRQAQMQIRKQKKRF